MLHTRVEAHDWLTVGQYDRQLQLCAPLVIDIAGDSYRLRDHHARTDNLRRALRPTTPSRGTPQ